MKRFVAALALSLVLALGGACAWWWFGPRGPDAGALAAVIPTGPIDCPQDPNDLAGIEGWAPGAGHAAQVGQTDTGNIGGFAGGLAGGASTPSPAPNASACAGLRGDVAARFDAIATAAQQLPAAGYDAAARAALLADPTAAFAFVRDDVHTEAYPGAMRGASGTLQSYAGSSADKALLLAALLAAKSVAVRFVHAQLSDADVATVDAAVMAAPAAPAQPNVDDATFAKFGVDPSAARAGAAALRARAESSANAVIANGRNATNDLLSTLGASATLGESADAARARRAGALRDHWWIQAHVAGTWTDLDPTLPGAAAGTHVGGAPADAPMVQLPPSAIDTMTVRLVGDTFSGDSTVPATSTILERTFALPDAYATPVVVTLGDRGVGTFAQATSFTPTIALGSDVQTGSAFKLDGLAAVRLQIEANQEGTVREIATRFVLDRRTASGTSIDASWTPEKTAAALTNTYAILPLAGELDVAFAGAREAAGLQELRAMMAYAAAGGNGRQVPPPAAEPYPLQALHYYEEDALVRRLIEDASSGAVRFAFDRPQVVIEHHGFTERTGPLAGVAEFDIADNGMALEGKDPAAGARANFTRGYVDTYVEQHLLAAPSEGGTIALFDAAKRAGVAANVRHGDDGSVQIVPASAVALNGSPRVGWWEVDLARGNLIGRMGPSGAGQELAEYAIARSSDWSTLYSMMQFYGDFFRCIAGSVEAPLSGMTQSQATGCFASAICNYLEALGSGEAFSRWGSDEEALLYNLLDLSVPGSKDSLPPTGGAACGAVFKSPLYP